MAPRFIIVYDIRTIGMVCAMRNVSLGGERMFEGMEICSIRPRSKERGALGCPAFMRDEIRGSVNVIDHYECN